MGGQHRASRRRPVGSHRSRPGPRLAVYGVSAAALAAVMAAVSLAATGTRGDEASGARPSTAAVSPLAAPPVATQDPVSPEYMAPRRPLSPRLDPTASSAPLPRGVAPLPQRPILPERGSGEMVVAGGSTQPVGSGTLVTYSVEVEREVPLDPARVASLVDEVLADPRGWTATGSHALARTNGESNIRILLATPETTDTLCLPLDTDGRLSCRNGDLVVLNAWRWLNGAVAYAQDLTNYRKYVISHEVGHALGNPHVDCPGPGEPAPVMMQQTKGIERCLPNAWPYPNVTTESGP